MLLVLPDTFWDELDLELEPPIIFPLEVKQTLIFWLIFWALMKQVKVVCL
jgi:hypothetical protein